MAISTEGLTERLELAAGLKAKVGTQSSIYSKSADGSKTRPSSSQKVGATSSAKANLIALLEVHSSLKQLEMECNKTHKDTVSTLSDWRITTQAAADEEDICTEFTTPPSRTSSGMLGAVSLRPNSQDLDVNFDSHDLGFWGDVGVKIPARARGSFDNGTLMIAISEENIMPWDL